MKMDGMLSGIRVLDSTTAVAMPTAMHILADMGAEVIKIETPTREESGRRDESFQYLHHSKKSMTINLKAPGGVQLYKDLVGRSDVLVENNRAGTLDRLGVGYSELIKVKPNIILLSNTGFGQTGPWKRYAGIGTFLELIAGVSHFTGYPDQGPRQVGNAWIDIHVAWMAVFSILAALHWREESGEGQHIDFSMYQVGVSTLGAEVLDFIVNGNIGKQMGNRHPVHAPHGVYLCRGDDKWIAIAVENDEEWRALLKSMGNPEWADNPKFEDALSRHHNQDEIDGHIAEWTKGWDFYELMHLLQGNGVIASVVPNTAELMTDPHMKARGFYEKLTHSPESGLGDRLLIGRPWKVSKTPSQFRGPAPTLGQDNEYIMKEVLKRTQEEIDELYEAGVLAMQTHGETPPSPQAQAAPARPRPGAANPAPSVEEGTLAYIDPDYQKRLGVE